MGRWLFGALSLLWAAACSSTSTTPADAGAHDSAGPADSGVSDAAADAGPASPCSGVTGKCTAFTSGTTTEREIANAFAAATRDETLAFGPGRFPFTNSLGLADVTNVKVKGAGMEETVLDFSAQAAGSEGILAQNSRSVTMSDFGVRDTKGNAIKVFSSTVVRFQRVKTEWTASDPHTHGAYGIYPVKSRDVLIEECLATGASDTGLYVGQSSNIVIRRNNVRQNVAGIEIENSFFADVTDNRAEGNTAGILVFDLPGLQQTGGHNVRVFNNQVLNNNTANFATPGNIVGLVPAGTGLVVMANHDIEIFGNTVLGNNTAAVSVISYLVTDLPITDPSYYPFPFNVDIHDNSIRDNGAQPDPQNALGRLLGSALSAYPGNVVPPLIYDGVYDPSHHGDPQNRMAICFKGNGDAGFIDLRLYLLDDQRDNLAMIMSTDIAPFVCDLPALPPVTLP